MRTYACNQCGCAIAEDDYLMGGCPLCGQSFRKSNINKSNTPTKPKMSQEFRDRFDRSLKEINKD